MGCVIVIFVVGVLMMIVFVILFGIIIGLLMLDVMDKFVNYFGIVVVVFVVLIVIVVNGKFSILGYYINKILLFKVGIIWCLCIIVIIGVLVFMLLSEGVKVFIEGYEGYLNWFVDIFGWGMVIFLVIVVFIFFCLLWKNEFEFNVEE